MIHPLEIPMKRLALSLSALMAVLPVRIFSMAMPESARPVRGDPYQGIAEKLAGKAAAKLSEKKIAVLSFEYMDGRQSPGGRAVTEKLTNRLVEEGEVTVIERAMVEKLINELEFQNSAAIDADTAKRLGKGLGVEAIVTGTLEDQADGDVEISARLIKTESFEIIAACSRTVEKTWRDQPAQSEGSSPEDSSDDEPERKPRLR